METLNTAYLSLGTNEGFKIKNLQKSINLIDEKVGELTKISSIYKTPSWGFEGDDFYNICVKVLTSLKPKLLLNKLLEIEKNIGRIRRARVYENRKIDIDILLFNNEIISTNFLKIPHPKMMLRSFVIYPLSEIDSTLYHPILKKNIASYLHNFRDNSDVTIIDETLYKPNAASLY